MIKKIKNKKDIGIANQMLGKEVEAWLDKTNPAVSPEGYKMYKCHVIGSDEIWVASDFAFEE